ncbi:unnamed protein product [Calicophoron daubneyi]|uniref:Uncharacterized protein n=1 Tax=Calicophoron daubneyi TaxID=300641 RepID=A0AAV2T666_CALDB
MSRRYGRYTSDSPLRRQHSVNSDPFYQTENNSTTLSVSPGAQTSTSSQSAWNNNFGESQRNMDKSYVHSPTSSRSPKLTVGNPPYREPSSPRYLSVLDQGFSGHSSMVAMSRGSQQPSFESYDSSMSMNSWASSNETDAMNTSAQGQYDPNQYSAQRSGLNLSSSYSGGGAGISPDYPEMINYADDRGNSSKRSDLSIRNTPVSQTREQPNRRKKFGFEALGSSSEAESTTPERSRDNRRKDTQSTGSSVKESRSIKSCLKKLDELKLIGSEMENPSDGKNSDGHGPPNIKGLWKRAFHSLRKDKGKSETDTMRKKEGSSSSVEIDPVYHLLRCAASKSQTTNPVRSTSGRPGEGMKITPAEAQLARNRVIERLKDRQRSTSLRLPRDL